MTYHWKALDMEIIDGEYQFDWTYTGKVTSYQTLDLKHVEIIKFSGKCTCKISFERSQLLNIMIIEHVEVKLYPLKPQTPKHVEIIKF